MEKVKMKKTVVSCLIMMCMLLNVSSYVYAEASSNIYESPQNTAGSWWSGYDEDEIVTMTSTSSKIYGGDVGVYFYASSVGMPKGFKRTTSRTVQIQLKEDDAALGNENELVRKYTGYFALDSAGRYRVTTYSTTMTTSSCIESNNTAELYIRVYVNVDSSDTTKNVPEGLFKYQYWAI